MMQGMGGMMAACMGSMGALGEVLEGAGRQRGKLAERLAGPQAERDSEHEVVMLALASRAELLVRVGGPATLEAPNLRVSVAAGGSEAGTRTARRVRRRGG